LITEGGRRAQGQMGQGHGWEAPLATGLRKPVTPLVGLSDSSKNCILGQDGVEAEEELATGGKHKGRQNRNPGITERE